MSDPYENYDRHERGVVSTCLRVYGAMSGTGDPMTDEESAKLLDWLRWRVGDAWDSESLKGWEEYEKAIRTMARKLLKAMDADDWAVECKSFHGRILYGKHAHWCVGWDDLPIDETCPEYHLDQVIPEDKDVPCQECGFKKDGR